jgi:hypothetical protein
VIFLTLIPVFVTIVLGPVFVFESSASRGVKLIGASVFALAVYLQFFSRFGLAGMLIQIGLALTLALWRRLDQ